MVFFIIIYVTLFNITSSVSSDILMEIFITAGSLVLLFFIISPSLLLLFETDIVVMPNTLINILGLQ